MPTDVEMAKAWEEYEHETVNSVSSMDGALELLVQRATRGLIGLYYLSDVRQAIESLLGDENVTM